jgi:ABC-2 type transport system ATP-binding protein
MTAPLLQAEGICKRYGRILALDDVDLQVQPGEVWGLVGPNGAGKSTLLKILCGLQRPDAGGVKLRGQLGSPRQTEFRRRVGFAPERPALYPRWTVRQNLDYFAQLRGLLAVTIPEELLLSSLLDRPAGELSRGQLQRAVIAVALLGDPELLLLDEPHGGLDLELLDALAGVVRACSSRGGAVILSSHVLSEVAQSCTHVALLRGGRVQAAGDLAALRAAAGLRDPGAELARVFRTLVGKEAA